MPSALSRVTGSAKPGLGHHGTGSSGQAPGDKLLISPVDQPGRDAVSWALGAAGSEPRGDGGTRRRELGPGPLSHPLAAWESI